MQGDTIIVNGRKFRLGKVVSEVTTPLTADEEREAIEEQRKHDETEAMERVDYLQDMHDAYGWTEHKWRLSLLIGRKSGLRPGLLVCIRRIIRSRLY